MKSYPHDILLFPTTSDRAFSYDVTAAILAFQNSETAAMLVYQENPVGVELFSYLNVSFVPKNLHRAWPLE